MPNQSNTLVSVERIAIRLAEELGYEWIDLELVKEPAGRFLRFYIDKEGGISLDDVEAFHRRIQPHAENIDYDYMEVSSPGIDRPLKKARDFERAQGKEIEVKLYKPMDGAKLFTGILVGLEDGRIVIEENGVRREFDQKAVALSRCVLNVDEDMLNDIDI
ncbi:MAG: ribosome maturation factor RimP [Clostridia bacterium]|nr:ribosome maturation factor RimP [Clostridia bacterium]